MKDLRYKVKDNNERISNARVKIIINIIIKNL